MCDSWNIAYKFSFAATHSAATHGSNFHLRLASMAVNFLFSLPDPLWSPNAHPLCTPVLQAKTQALHKPASTSTQWKNEGMDVCLLLH